MNVAQLYKDIFLNWHTLLDIILLGAGVFFLYRTFLRLGTWKILVGIFAAFLLFAIARLLNLEGIIWVYRNVSHVLLLALIIIFQPELRKILENVVSVAVGKKSKPTKTTTTTIAESLWSLAKLKRGAIIVLPGKEQIGDKASGGYSLYAIPSVPLLKSAMDEFAISSPKALLDLSKMAEGKQKILVTSDNIKHPNSLSLLDISPSELKLSLVAIVEKTMPVRPQFIGRLPGEMKMKSFRVIPGELQVLAPAA